MSGDSPSSGPPADEGASSRLDRIARGGVLMLGGSGIETVLGYAVMLLTARLLGKDHFGILNLGLYAVAVNVILTELGLPTAVMRYVAVYDGEGDASGAKGAALGGTLISGGFAMLGALLLLLFPHWVAERLFGKPDLARILPVMAVQLPATTVMATLLRITQGRGTMRYRVLVEKLVLPASRLVFIGGLLVLGYGLAGAAWGSTLSALAALAVAAYYSVHIMHRAWGAARPRYEIWRLIRYSLPLMLSSVALMAKRRGITLALGVGGTAGDVGVFAAAERTSLAGAMGLDAVGSIFAPFAADLYNRNQREELHRILKTGTAWVFMVVLPLSLFLALGAPEVMGLLGKGFPEGCIALVLLSLAQIVSSTFGSVDYLFAMTHRQWIAVIDQAFFGAVAVWLALRLGPEMGVKGAAIAGTIAILGPRITRVVEVAIIMRMNPFGPGHLRVFASAFPAGLLLLAWRQYLSDVAPVAFWPAIVPLYFALYVVALRTLAREEFEGLAKVVRERRQRARRPGAAEPLAAELPPPDDPPENGLAG